MHTHACTWSIPKQLPGVLILSLLQARSEAIGVVGVVQCDFLEPNHIKQDFNKTNNRYKLVFSFFYLYLHIGLCIFWNIKVDICRNSGN